LPYSESEGSAQVLRERQHWETAVTYQVLADDGKPLDAHFDLDKNTIIFHSRGGSKKRGARNTDYSTALRLLVQRLLDAGRAVEKAWVDSKPVQGMPISDRVILQKVDSRGSAYDMVSKMAYRMQGIGRQSTSTSDHGNSTKRIRLEIVPPLTPGDALKLLKAKKVAADFRSEDRLPASQLKLVTAEHLFEAAQRLRGGYSDHDFAESTDYDVLLDDGTRLPPKAVFGLAATLALGFEVKPRNFTAGSTSFRILRDAGFQIVEKGTEPEKDAEIVPPDQEWSEGNKKLRTHLRSERSASLSKAKKAEFRRIHGRLYCERCGLDPVKEYETDLAESCIEVHHAKVAVAKMKTGHKTRLEDLECLCANCHRLAHRELRVLAKSKSRGHGPRKE
jgi:5-methylcytosine-specific restriction protein A